MLALLMLIGFAACASDTEGETETTTAAAEIITSEPVDETTVEPSEVFDVTEEIDYGDVTF